MRPTDEQSAFMNKAMSLAVQSVANGGGPFGAVVVKNGYVVGEGYNRVVLDNDPTAHAEVVAIRQACQRLETFDLSDCELYTSCEPCPMCLFAVVWAGIKKVYYVNTRQEAGEIGFREFY